MNSDRRLIDEIIFLSGLTSSVATIDPLLDAVRSITANHSEDNTLKLSDTEHRTLAGVRAKLCEYLIGGDALRHFTRESLQHTLDEQFGTAEPGHLSLLGQAKAQLTMILVVIGAIFVVSSVTLFAFRTPYWWLLSASTTVVSVLVSSCWFFVVGFSTFTPALRRAFAWICAAVVMLGCCAALWMLFTIIPSVHDIPVLHYGLPYISFGVAFIVAYMGVRAFAQAQQVESPLTSLWIVVPISAAVCTAVMLLPHVSTIEDRYLDTTMVGVALISYYGYVIALLVNRVRHTLTRGYARAIGLFGAGYGLSATVGLAAAAVLLFTGTGFGAKLMILGMFYATGGMLVFFSGYLFRLSSVGQLEGPAVQQKQ